MALDRTKTLAALRQCDFRSLFLDELGWENPPTDSVHITVGDAEYELTPVSHKRGMVAFTSTGASIPDHATRQKVSRAAAGAAHEHLIIFVDSDNETQLWQWLRREPGAPSAIRQHRFQAAQSGESLIQKLESIAFDIDEEEDLTITAVANRAKRAFDVDRVTKRFYDQFKSEHANFLGFVEGILNQGDREWYASLMLNRLMFVYFIQKKGFLDGDVDYLRNRLRVLQEAGAKNQFHSFYRRFLLRLFHEAFGKPERTPELDELVGSVPYLNGGLFEEHELEQAYADIDIPDHAFQALFDFFDGYQWHLDERALRNDDEINPDVLGHIFEKYVNQRQMGAYYTKDDISEYMSSATIIPVVFDRIRDAHPEELDNAWSLLADDPDRYIFPELRHGASKTLPAKIAVAADELSASVGRLPASLLEQRGTLNAVGSSDIALTQEWWRESLERRARYQSTRMRLESGEIRSIDELVTLNLDLRQFAQDSIDSLESPTQLLTTWRALTGLTVLDPTCGSGAFLFAALNILQPLYDGCLARMEAFIDEWDGTNSGGAAGEREEFQSILSEVAAHPNREYFVLKRIVLGNLFGVDIMEEAVEICKLRLFLKLAAHAQPDLGSPNLGIEPLPDIDFNIRAGNSLVGFATFDEVDLAVNSKLDFDNSMAKIEREASALQNSFDRFRTRQTDNHGPAVGEAKAELQEKLSRLRAELNKYLAADVGVPGSDEKKLADWEERTQPFHWFAEFYGVMSTGGFDVVIGNPPYVEYRAELKRKYSVAGYSTAGCRNLHAFCVERGFQIASDSGRVSWIVPLPSINTERMAALQSLVKPPIGGPGRCAWISSFDERPSNLFSGVDQRLVVEVFGGVISQPSLCSTGIIRWFAQTRGDLFPSITYSIQPPDIRSKTHSILKVKDSRVESELLEKFYSNAPIDMYRVSEPRPELVSYRTAGGRYWKVVLDSPFPSDTVSGKTAYLDGLTGRQAVALLSSSTFWWYYSVHFDMFNLKDYMIWGFRFSDPSVETQAELHRLGGDLVASLEANAEHQAINSKTRGDVQQKTYEARKSKPVIDQIDTVLARHYGFDSYELDFIVNYDLKFRMGGQSK